MRTILWQNSRGFTMVELLAATVIILVGMMALLQSVNVAIQHNAKNQQRAEVTRVADEVMSGMRSAPFGTPPAVGSSFVTYTTVKSAMRTMNHTYAVRRKTTGLSAESVRYEVDVRWAYNNYSATHSIVTVRGNTQ